MPVWPLKELQLVGTYMLRIHSEFNVIVDFTEDAINCRYQRFGGIFQYVLPSSDKQYQQAIKDQALAQHHVQLKDIFAPFRSIEKTLLHYNVEQGFTDFTMKIASDYVQSNLIYDMNEDQLCEGIQSIKNTFNYGASIMPELFERVVYNMIPNEQYFPWKIYDDDIMNGTYPITKKIVYR